MRALNGIPFAVPGITWRSTAQIHVANIVPGATWAACTAARLETVGANLSDGASHVLEERAMAYEHACLTRLVVTTDARWGASRGLGQFSTRAAESFTGLAAEALAVADANTVFVPTGGVLTHFPVGEALAALGQVKTVEQRDAPGTTTEGKAKFLALHAISAEGAITVGTGCFLAGDEITRDGLGEVWLAATDASVARGVLDALLERLWLMGPAALRLAHGGAHPADALIVIATGHRDDRTEITDLEDPRLEPIAALLSVALTMVARSRAKEEDLSEVSLDGAGSSVEAMTVAGKLAPLLAGVRRNLQRERGDAEKIGEKRQFLIATALRAGLIASAIPGLEYTLIQAQIEDCVLLNGSATTQRVHTGEKESDTTAQKVIQKWLTGNAQLEIKLGRGQSEARFFV